MIKLNKIYILLLASIPFFLISGPFFPDVIVSFSSLVFLIYIFKHKLFYYFYKKPVIIFFIFCIYCVLVSIFVAQNILLSFESSLFYFRVGVFACLIWYLIEKNKKILNYFYYALFICFTVLAVDGFIQFFYGKNIIGLTKSAVRISSFFGEERILGSYLSRLFPLLFALFTIKEKNKYELYYIGILFFLVDVLIYLSGERTAFFYLNLSTLFMLILIKEYKKFRLIIFIASIIFIVILTTLNSNVRQRMIIGPLETTGFTKESKEKYFFSQTHDSLIRTAYNMFKDKPFFGHGPKMFRVVCKDEKYAQGILPCETHPHNFYVQLLAETGIIGFLFLFGVLYYVLYCGYRQLKSIVFKKKRYLTDYQVCLLAGILITAWPLAPNGNFFNNWLAITYSLPIGFYLHSIYGKNRKSINSNYHRS